MHPQEQSQLASEQETQIVPEMASGVASPMRRHLFAMAAGICGATAATAIFKPSRADIIEQINGLFYLDPTVLKFAVEMEELEADFFARVFRSGGVSMLSGRERNLMALFAQQDKEHYDSLKALSDRLGSATESPLHRQPQFPRAFSYPSLNSRESVLETALDIKENVLFAYHGAVGLLRNNNLLAVAAAIAGVEGRHVAALRYTMGMDAVPAPFEGALTVQSVSSELKGYNFKGGARRESGVF